MERGKQSRYRLAAAVSYCWEREDGSLEESEGTTRDVSPTGAFVSTPNPPPVAARVQMEVSLPPLEGTKRGALLHGEGVVLRVDRTNGRVVGFAAEVVFQTEKIGQTVFCGLENTTIAE